MEDNGEEKDQDTIKLFVGQIPRTYTEDDLREIFQEYGAIHDITVLREKATNAHRGCAFLTFMHRDSAEEAMKALHLSRTLPGMVNPMQVKPADSEGKAEERKLFVGMIPKSYVEEDLTPMFAPFGTIEELNILKSADGKSKGCAFLRYATKHQAREAIAKLHHSTTLPGCSQPLVVKIADTEKEKERKRLGKMMEQQAQLGMVNPMANYYQQLINQHVQQIATGSMPLAPGPKPGDTAAMYGGAVAMNQQTPQGSTPGMLSATVGLQQAQQTQLGGLGTQIPVSTTTPNGSYASTSLAMQNYYHQQQQPYQTDLTSQALAGYQQGQLMTAMGQMPVMQTPGYTKPKEGPEGANLFIYHLPHHTTDADLAQLFSTCGNVISAKVYIDKDTSMSRGFGFVSYDNPASAQLAIQTMNGHQTQGKRLKVSLKKSKPNTKPY